MLFNTSSKKLLVGHYINDWLQKWEVFSQDTTQINGFSHDESQHKPKFKKARLQEYPYNKCCYTIEFIFGAAIYS